MFVVARFDCNRGCASQWRVVNFYLSLTSCNLLKTWVNQCYLALCRAPHVIIYKGFIPQRSLNLRFFVSSMAPLSCIPWLLIQMPKSATRGNIWHHDGAALQQVPAWDVALEGFHECLLLFPTSGRVPRPADLVSSEHREGSSGFKILMDSRQSYPFLHIEV